MYKSFVRPHLDYCDIIYHQPSKEDANGQSLSKAMEDIEKVQYKAALIVSGAWKGSNQTKLFNATNRYSNSFFPDAIKNWNYL